MALNPTLLFSRQTYYSKDDGTGESYVKPLPMADQTSTSFFFVDKVSFGTNAQIQLIVETQGDNGANFSSGETVVAATSTAGKVYPLTAVKYGPQAQVKLFVSATSGSAQVHATVEIWVSGKSV
jgi:hypothetical protein